MQTQQQTDSLAHGECLSLVQYYKTVVCDTLINERNRNTVTKRKEERKEIHKQCPLKMDKKVLREYAH